MHNTTNGACVDNDNRSYLPWDMLAQRVTTCTLNFPVQRK